MGKECTVTAKALWFSHNALFNPQRSGSGNRHPNKHNKTFSAGPFCFADKLKLLKILYISFSFLVY